MNRSLLLSAMIAVVVWCLFYYSKTFARSFAAPGESAGLSDMKEEITAGLKETVYYLADEIGPRSYTQTDAIRKTTAYIKSKFSSYGYTVSVQPYPARGRTFENIVVAKDGDPLTDRLLVIGAHYDTVPETPGADDNASGVAALLELARLFARERPARTIHFVAFALEEPPFFRTAQMGSHVYAKGLHDEGRQVDGMICLESMGFFSDRPESQMFPLPLFRYFYPTTGNYITFVSNFRSGDFLDRAITGFRRGTSLHAESLSSFPFIPGIDFSDHRSFWKFGYDAVMVTDTAFYRNPNYHGIGDTASTLDYERLTEVVIGLKASIQELAGE